MKRILSLLLVICISFCVVGCNKVTDVNSSGLSSTETNSNKNELESTKDEKLDLLYQFAHDGVGQIKKEVYDLSQFGGIKDFDSNSNLFISTDGSLYKIGNFSDGTNFKKINSNVKFVKFKGYGTGFAIVSEHNEVYRYNNEDFSVASSGYYNYDYDYINSAELFDRGMNFCIDGFIKNKELFLYEKEGFNLPEKAIYKFDDEEIEYLVDGIIKTNKEYYYLEETIKESEFNDIPTTYEYKLLKIENISDDIIFFKYNGWSISALDKDNHLFVYTYIGG
ncbi:MAG: hypothetical protein J6B22_01185 [Clostridia bacterium]|nr:hypothetical protein [Clostridia bacterium]